MSSSIVQHTVSKINSIVDNRIMDVTKKTGHAISKKEKVQFELLRETLIQGIQTSYGSTCEKQVLDAYEDMTTFSVTKRNTRKC